VTRAIGFEQECQTAIGQLRAALMGLYAGAGAPLDQPQEVSRAFKVNKNLAWKLSKLMGATEPGEALQYLPGMGGMKIFLKAMQQAGGPGNAIEEVRAAYDRVEQAVLVHVGDRPTLELVLDGLGPARAERLEVSRKLAFRGMSGVWGVQARSKVTVAAMAPSRSRAGMLDTAMIRGYLGLRRLRSTMSWPISVRGDWKGEHEPYDSSWEPLEPGQVVNGLALLGDFTSPSAPAFELNHTPEGTYFMLPPGPVGNTAAFDCFFGEGSRADVPRYATAEDKTGEFTSAISVPIEQQVLDVLVHKDLAEGFAPEPYLFGNPFGHGGMGSAERTQCHLPIGDRVHRLPGSPPITATPVYARYPALVDLIYRRMGWTPGEFVGYRLMVKYPPMGTVVSVRFPLPEGP
jgi:hypothetical protein